MKIIKIGTFSDGGCPVNWAFDAQGDGHCLGIDLLYPGSVDVNGVEIVEWTAARRKTVEVTDE